MPHDRDRTFMREVTAAACGRLMPIRGDELTLRRARCHHEAVQQDFSRFAGDAHTWVDELPDWASLSPVGEVTGYWRWRGSVPSPVTRSSAAWGYRIGFGGHGEYGVLGARFDPHEHPFLRVTVPATEGLGEHASQPFDAARLGLPHEFLGGVLIGALQEPDRLGAGTLTFSHAAVHDVDSSWETFRLLAIGVIRLLGSAPEEEVSPNLLPHFGGTNPEAPGAI